jgi:hypothetical protein
MSLHGLARFTEDLDIFVEPVWAFGRRARPRAFPPGVRKFRSIAEMKARP